jgi:hypothetical protein
MVMMGTKLGAICFSHNTPVNLNLPSKVHHNFSAKVVGIKVGGFSLWVARPAETASPTQASLSQTFPTPASLP